MEALLGEFGVVAGSAVDVVALGEEALGLDGLLAFEASEAVLVPRLVLVLHILSPWNTKRSQRLIDREPSGTANDGERLPPGMTTL